MRSAIAAAAAAALLLVAGAVQARPIPAAGLTVEEVAAFLKSAGFEARIEKGSDGAPYVTSMASDINFDVDLYDCDAGRCRALQFVASFDLKAPLGAEKANAWNLSKRYIRVYLDQSGDPIFAYDANVAPGGTYEALQDDLDVFTQFLPEMLEHIGW